MKKFCVAGITYWCVQLMYYVMILVTGDHSAHIGMFAAALEIIGAIMWIIAFSILLLREQALEEMVRELNEHKN